MASSKRVRYIKDKFYGGMSTDEYIGQVGSCYDAEGVEMRSNSKEVTLSRGDSGGIPNSISAENSNIITMFKYYEDSSNYVFLCSTTNKSIADVSNRSGTVITTTNKVLTIGSVKISGVSGIVGFYIDDNGGLYRWGMDISTPLGNIATASNVSGTPGSIGGNGKSAPYIVLRQNFLIYGVGNIIYVVDISSYSTWVVLKTIYIDPGYKVVGLTNISDQIIVYASNDLTFSSLSYTGIGSGRVFYYTFDDLVSGANYTRSIQWNDRPILGVKNVNNVDYIVTGTANKRQLWENNGINPTLIAQSKITTNANDKFFFDCPYGHSIGNIGDIILISSSGNVYSYGSKIPGLPNSIWKEFPTITGCSSNCFLLDDSVPGSYSLYIAVNNAANIPQYRQINLLSGYRSTGFVTDNPIIGDWEGDKKASVKFTIGMNLEANTSIQVQASVNDGDFTNIGSAITAGGYQRRPFVYTGNWQKIQFKYVLSTTNSANTPHLFAGYFIYDINQEDVIN